MSKLIASKYNYEFTNVDGNPLILNGISGTIIEKPSMGLQGPDLSADDISFLAQHHFLHDASEDQGELLLRRNALVKDAPSLLELTIALHEECNFRCTYCNQDFQNRAFDDPLQARLFSYLDEHLPTRGTLHVHYYGGEPLLAWDHLVRLDQDILAFATEREARYRFFLTSNGSLLTEDKVDYLERRDVAHVKVTLDGPPEVHDARRVKKGGQGTYADIIRNVAAAAPRIPIVIRVNIDGSNYDSIPELLDCLSDALSACGPDRISLDYNIVYDGRARRLAPDVSYRNLYELQRRTLAAGFRLRLPPMIRHRHCKFNSPKSALIDTNGALYVCDKTPELQVGELPGGAGEAAAPKKLPLFRPDPRDAFVNLRSECRSCSVLPLCGGGCSLLASGNLAPACPPWKSFLHEYLQIHYHAQHGEG